MSAFVLKCQAVEILRLHSTRLVGLAALCAHVAKYGEKASTVIPNYWLFTFYLL